MISIYTTVKKFILKYQTRKPYELAEALGITIIFEDLGTINGYYSQILRMKQIHINHNLSEHMQAFTAAHELGHAILHPKANTQFFNNNTFFVVSKMEKEANQFAALLLIPDEIIMQNIHMTTAQLSRLLGYDQKFIELRLESYFDYSEN